MNVDHILITSDLSPESLRPCRQISDLARKFDARITLLHVVTDLVAIPYGAPLAPAPTLPPNEKALEHAQMAIEDQGKTFDEDLGVQSVVITGDSVPHAINEFVKEHEVDLVALSTHGRTGLRHLALGSVAEAILRHAEVPVICFPQQKE